MTLQYLRRAPNDSGAREKFWWNHYQDHIKILRVVAKTTNTKQYIPVIWPVQGTFTAQQAQQHQLLHDQMNSLSKYNTSDMTHLNFNDPDQFRLFVDENWAGHFAFYKYVGVPA